MNFVCLTKALAIQPILALLPHLLSIGRAVMGYHMWPYISCPFLDQLLFLPFHQIPYRRKGLFGFTVRGHSPSWWQSHQIGSSKQLVTYPASEHRGEEYLWPARLLRLLQPRIPAHGMVLPIVRGIFLPYSQSDLETDSRVCPEVGLLDLVQ